MVMTRVKEVGAEHVLRMFECADCGIAQVMHVELSDPATLRWIVSGVRPAAK
jgi:hypothetical protein